MHRITAAAMLILLLCATRARPELPPNVILILTDDMGYGDLGCQGSPTNRTPRLDALAKEGTRLTSFYVWPSCTPSRAALLTGRLPIRMGLQGVLGPGAPNGMPAPEVTLAEALKARGYTTGCVGKWHLGDRPRFRPTRHGFDRYFGLLYSHDLIPPWFRTRQPLQYYDGERALPEKVDPADLTARFTKHAIQFLRTNKDQPFFLYVSHCMPHVPLAVREGAGRSPGGLYGDVIEELDRATGRLLDELAELNLDQRTILIFTSDNGPWHNLPPRMLVDDRIQANHGGSAGILRGSKGTTYEGGVRVPFLMRWPGQIPAARVADDMVSSLDLFPSLLALTGSPATSDEMERLDGLDVSGFLRGEGPCPRDRIHYFRGGKLEALRVGPWKLLDPTWTPTGEGLELYNLEADPQEQRNLVESQPEQAQSLHKLLREIGKR